MVVNLNFGRQKIIIKVIFKKMVVNKIVIEELKDLDEQK